MLLYVTVYRVKWLPSDIHSKGIHIFNWFIKKSTCTGLVLYISQKPEFSCWKMCQGRKHQIVLSLLAFIIGTVSHVEYWSHAEIQSLHTELGCLEQLCSSVGQLKRRPHHSSLLKLKSFRFAQTGERKKNYTTVIFWNWFCLIAFVEEKKKKKS